MSIGQKALIKAALKLAIVVASSTENQFDDFIVKAAVSILVKIFSINMED